MIDLLCEYAALHAAVHHIDHRLGAEHILIDRHHLLSQRGLLAEDPLGVIAGDLDVRAAFVGQGADLVYEAVLPARHAAAHEVRADEFRVRRAHDARI